MQSALYYNRSKKVSKAANHSVKKAWNLTHKFGATWHNYIVFHLIPTRKKFAFNHRRWSRICKPPRQKVLLAAGLGKGRPWAWSCPCHWLFDSYKLLARILWVSLLASCTKKCTYSQNNSFYSFNYTLDPFAIYCICYFIPVAIFGKSFSFLPL